MRETFRVSRPVKRAKRERRPDEPVAVRRVHPDVLRTARTLHGYDPRRLVIVSETEVVLVNHR